MRDERSAGVIAESCDDLKRSGTQAIQSSRVLECLEAIERTACGQPPLNLVGSEE